MNDTPLAEYIGPGTTWALGSVMASRIYPGRSLALPLYWPEARSSCVRADSPASEGPAMLTPGDTEWQAAQAGGPGREHGSSHPARRFGSPRCLVILVRSGA